ncbi:hypothetical protein SDC9_124122 [bioreactor metagenome]|uniref:Uncharacterized protein n=1 Tax=bioreactor metagenome TaxID=1076179 RepID=A0A645CK35_9ZZZZ
MDISCVKGVERGGLIGYEYHFYLVYLYILTAIIFRVFGNGEVVSYFIGFQYERSVRDTGLWVLFPSVAVFFHYIFPYRHEGEERRKVEEVWYL